MPYGMGIGYGQDSRRGLFEMMGRLHDGGAAVEPANQYGRLPLKSQLAVVQLIGERSSHFFDRFTPVVS